MTLIYIHMKIESHALNALSESFIGAFHIHCLSSRYHIASNFRGSKIHESLQISVEVNFHDKNFVINFRDSMLPCPFFSKCTIYPPRDMCSNYFVNKIFHDLDINREVHENIVP